MWADPDRITTILDHLDGISLIFWLLGSARGEPGTLGALHGPRLERLVEEIVDTPVRGLVYEAAGSVPATERRRGEEILRAAGERWRIPVEVVAADPDPVAAWRAAMLAAAGRLTES
jgi:hypothetical protein